MNYILPIDSLHATQINTGGKGARLAELARVGLPVPPGFIITCEAYDAFVAANGLSEAIIRLSQISGATLSEVKIEAGAIFTLFEKSLMPPLVATAIRAAYRNLEAVTKPVDQAESPLFAVRSSAVAEDLAEASFAGQLDTFLNVQGETELFKAVVRVWASLWGDRVLIYRQRQANTVGLQSRGSPGLAVIVQQMVRADSAGVMFTLNPLTGDLQQIAIEACWGSGESIVSGQVSPDRFLVNKTTGKLLHAELGDQPVRAVPFDEGIRKTSIEDPQRQQAVLNETQIADLVRLGNSIEGYFGAPCDIEWAIAEGRVYLIQSRPVTALAAQTEPVIMATEVPGDDAWPAVDERMPQPYDLWSQAILGEAWPHAISPLMWSGIPAIISGSIRQSLRGLSSSAIESSQWARRFHGHVYYNEGALVYLLSNELGLPVTFVNAAVGSRRNEELQQQSRFRPLTFLRRLPFLMHMARSQIGTGRELEHLFSQIDGWAGEFSEVALRDLSDEALWKVFLIWVARFNHAISLQAEMSNIGITAFSLLEWILGRWLKSKELSQLMITGLSGVYAAEMGKALWQIALALEQAGLADVVLEGPPSTALERLRSSPEAGPVLIMLEAFLRAFGHRCPNEGEWLNPRWTEAPEQLLPLIRGYLHLGAQKDLVEAETRQRARRDEAIALAEARLAYLPRMLFRLILARAQHGARLRDNGKHYYMKLALPIRRIYLAFGERWAGRNWLEKPEDIFFLTIPDIIRVVETGAPAEASLDLHTLVVERRKAYEHWLRIDTLPTVISSDGRPLARQPVEANQELILTGIPASGGVVRGTARIVHEPHQATDLGPGVILVTRAADPGWTPIFSLVDGLVLEVGGQLSHAAIVARECSLPAVVNVHDATHLIRDGQLIMVDGTNGLIHLLPGNSP